MMRRLTGFLICAIPGLGMLICGLLVPAHLRSVDAGVLQKAGRNTASLTDQGLTLLRQNKLGAAQLLLQAAQTEGLPDRQRLGLAITNSAMQHPRWMVWGGGDARLERLFGSDAHLPKSGSEPFTDFVVREENRAVVFELLRASPLPAVQEVLQCRALTNTVIFSPSQSASGQALDTALAVCGLLLEGGHLSGGLSDAVFGLAGTSNLGGDPQRLEQVLLDLMSLGQRFNWGQLVGFVGQIQDTETLRLLANLVRKSDGQLPVLFAAVQLSGKPAQAAAYLMNFSQTGVKDLGASLRFGVGGVNELLQRNRRLHSSGFGQRVAGQAPFDAFGSFAADLCWRMPRLALTMKWVLYLAGGFLLAMALHFARPAASVLERPLQVRGFHVAREILFALGFLLVVLLLSEPFLAQESQRVEFPFRLRLPTVGSVVPAGAPGVHRSIMNQLSLLTLLLFFVLQALLYTASLVKLAEIRRQNLPSRIRLKLLENEDHLFDAGLYLGFAGTIISLILVSLGVIQPSLMAAYSSTSFGIIFVSVFKIFHLRPERRKLLLEAERAPAEPLTPAGASRVRHPVMNRSILIVICDFLLVSLLAFSTVDINKTTSEGVPRQVKTTIATNPIATNQPDSRQDLAAVMRLALEDERKGRDLLLRDLAKARDAASQQQALLSERERQVQTFRQELQQKEQQVQTFRQDLQQKDQQTIQLALQQTNLLQQFVAAQTNIQTLSQQLQSSSTEALISKEKLAAMQAELRKQAEQAAALQRQLGHLAQSNQLVLTEKQRLAGQLQVAEAEKRMATEQATRMQEEVKVERAEKAKLADGVKALATRSDQLAQEIQQNRPLAPNTIFSDFVTNRVQASLSAVRPGFFGAESHKRTDTQTVLVTDGTNTVALCHVQDTPLSFGFPGTEWEGLTGTLGRNSALIPIRLLSFYQLDPRMVFIPVTPAEARQLGGKVYRTSSDPYKFQDAVLVGAQEGYYGECTFQIDLTTPLYVKMDRNSLKGLFGKFNPSRGDLVFSRTGELLGVMANSTYCMMIKNFNATATFQFAQDVRNQQTGETLARLYSLIAKLPYKLQ